MKIVEITKLRLGLIFKWSRVMFHLLSKGLKFPAEKMVQGNDPSTFNLINSAKDRNFQ